ncbi:MAG TPA: hypothetical protein VI336_03740 [Candidatus Saccharimonadales bacterium]|nr:hypothetical protein [Candidatus Saccharimonadales bacterium]
MRPLKILLSTYTLDLSGVPTYTLTLYKELVKRGHKVAVYSPGNGPLAELMDARPNFDKLETPDVILAQANKCAIRMKDRFPKVPMIFINHGVLPALEQPPRIPIDWYIAVNEQSVNLLIRQYVDPERIDIVRDFVDTERFKPLEPLQAKPRVLFISNYKKWKTYYTIEAACKNLGLEFRAVGSPYGRSRDIVKDINQADLVISMGRGIIEAMACGRAAISYSELLGDGYLTPRVYMESRARNFGGYECRYAFNVEALAAEINKYSPNSGRVNRDLALKYHDSVKGTDEILGVVNKII